MTRERLLSHIATADRPTATLLMASIWQGCERYSREHLEFIRVQLGKFRRIYADRSV